MIIESYINLDFSLHRIIVAGSAGFVFAREPYASKRPTETDIGRRKRPCVAQLVV